MKNKATTEVVEAKAPALKENRVVSLSPESLISQAIDKNVPVETMEKLLAMRRELKAEQARELFNRAMAEFQAECPVIKKSTAGGKTNDGRVAYYYATLDSIVLQTKDLIKKHGFSYSIQTETMPGRVKVTCNVKHEAGHQESSSVEVPIQEGTRVMSASQVVAAALTFAKRYAFQNVFGILTGDEDNDAKPVSETEAPKKPINYKAKINFLLKTLGVDMDQEASLIQEQIKDLTGIEAKEINYPEILSKLEALVIEKRKVGAPSSEEIPF